MVLSSTQKKEYISIDFIETAGFVFVHAYPWAKVYIDDQLRDITPLMSPLVVSAGKRIVRFEHPNFNSIEKEIYVHSQETVKVYVDFRNQVTQK